MICTSCLTIFTAFGPYFDHHQRCTDPPSRNLVHQYDQALVNELALLLWRNAVVAEVQKLPNGQKFKQHEDQLQAELDILWTDCTSREMIHCHELFTRVALSALCRKAVLPTVTKLYNEATKVNTFSI